MKKSWMQQLMFRKVTWHSFIESDDVLTEAYATQIN